MSSRKLEYGYVEEAIIEGKELNSYLGFGLGKGKCKRCGRTKQLTKHSLTGHHKPPYIIVCRECHDKLDKSK